jgi:molecular chaperone GrpE
MPDKKNAPSDAPVSFEMAGNVGARAEEEADPGQVEPTAGEANQSEDAITAEKPEEGSAPEPSRITQLQSQVDVLMAERASFYDKLLRRQAEFDNYRKRVERERAELYQRGKDDVLLQFLPVVDNFERALSSLEESEGDAEALLRGLELIHKQFKDALAKFGLEPVEAVGQAFDPHVHEAVTTEATDKHKENTVIEEFQRGYRIGDRLLRPAKVKVASSPEK